MKFLLAAVFLFSSIVSAQDWKKYPYYPPNSKVEFPRDEGAHPYQSALEWWYVVMHVKGDKTGDEYSILVTHFNNTYRFFTITNVTKDIHESGTVRGKITSQQGSMNVTRLTEFGKDFFRTKKDKKGNLVPFEYELKTHHSKMGLEASLQSMKAPLMVGGTGFVEIGTSGFSWYYSLTRLAAKGKLTLNGVTESFTGIGWIDHQWGPFLVSPVELGGVFETYEWFCVQLDNGTEFMISNIYDRFYNLPKLPMYGGVGIMNPDGSIDGTLDREFTRLGYWQDPVSLSYMSMGWQLKVPKWNLDLVLTPKMKNQMVQFPFGGSFWEGSAYVTGTLNGVPVQGQAFGELIHHFKKPNVVLQPLKKNYFAQQPIDLRWWVTNKDDGNPLKYSVELIGEQGAKTIAQNLEDDHLQFFPMAQTGQYEIRVTAHSIDKTIQGSTTSEPFQFIGN